MEKIKVENLATEIKEALEEVFVAELTQKQENIFLRFFSGQKFVLSIREN